MTEVLKKNDSNPILPQLKKYSAPVLLALITLAVFAPSLKHQFIPFLDDSAYLLANPAAHGFSPPNIRAALTGYYVGNYAPLHIISYMLDHTIWGLNPSGFILTNIILHTANGLLFHYLLLRIGLTRTVALFSSLIFLIHPVQVEAVVWVSQRKTVLAMLFFLAAFHYYLSYRESRSSQHYILSLATFACALLSKSVAVILPLALILHDISFGAKTDRRLFLKDKLPYLSIALAGAVMAYLSQDPASLGGRTAYHGGSPWATFLTMLTVLMKYLQLVFWPINLGISYSLPTRTSIDAAVISSALACLMLLIAGYLLFRRRRGLFFWYALFFVGLLPVSQVVPIVTLINDRYLYFPMLGMAPFVCSVIADAVERDRRLKAGTLLLAISLTMALSLMTLTRADVWRNTSTALEDILRHTPDNRTAWTILTNEYLVRGDYGNLLKSSVSLLSRFPDDSLGLKMAGTAALRTGDVTKARAWLARHVDMYPEEQDTCLLLASTFPDAGERAAIEKQCRNNQGQ